MGVGVMYPSADTARRMDSARPSSLKVFKYFLSSANFRPSATAAVDGALFILEACVDQLQLDQVPQGLFLATISTTYCERLSPLTMVSSSTLGEVDLQYHIVLGIESTPLRSSKTASSNFGGSCTTGCMNEEVRTNTNLACRRWFPAPFV